MKKMNRLKEKFSKVKYNDSILWKQYLSWIAVFSSIITIISFFTTAQTFPCNIIFACVFLVFLILVFILFWYRANCLQEAHLKINHTKVNIVVGDIFKTKCGELNVIGVNDFFDTIADDRIIAKNSLHGQYLQKNKNRIDEIDRKIASDETLKKDVIETDVKREKGRKVRYKLGSMVEYDSFILTAFTRFDEHNKAFLTSEQYLDFWMEFWKNIDGIYAGRTLNIPLMGAGIARFRNGKLSKQQLLEIMLWTLKVSGFHCTYGSRSINFIIYKDDVKEVDFYRTQHRAEDW